MSGSTSFGLAEYLAHSSTVFIFNLKFSFQVNDLGSLYLEPFGGYLFSVCLFFISYFIYFEVACYDMATWMITKPRFFSSVHEGILSNFFIEAMQHENPNPKTVFTSTLIENSSLISKSALLGVLICKCVYFVCLNERSITYE